MFLLKDFASFFSKLKNDISLLAIQIEKGENKEQKIGACLLQSVDATRASDHAIWLQILYTTFSFFSQLFSGLFRKDVGY